MHLHRRRRYDGRRIWSWLGGGILGGGVAPGPGSGDGLLLEGVGGFFLLIEDGSFLLLE